MGGGWWVVGGVVSATLRIVILCKHSIRVDILKQDSILEKKNFNVDIVGH